MSISANFPNVFPSLELNFAQSQQLDPRVTFSRSTTAPYYDGKTSALAEQNLLLQSQNFATTWSNSGVASISTTATTAPDGTSTGNSITEDTSTGVHRFNQTVTTLASTSYVFSIYLKYSNCQYVSLINSPVNNSATFDLVNGTVTTSSGTLSNFITNVGNGWYRVGYVVNNLNAGSTQFFVQMMDSTGTTNNYTGTSRLIYTWGAQLEQRSSATAYNATTTSAITNYIPQLLTAPINQPRFDFNPTTGESLGLLIEQSSTNLLTYSQDFSNAVWTKPNSTITATANIAPDGTQTASQFFDNTTNSLHTLDTGNFAANTYTFSLYAKAGTSNYIGLYSASTSTGVFFNLLTGTFSSNIIGAPTSYTINPVGNGWYRCSVTMTTTTLNIFRIIFSTDGTTYSYVGTGKYVFIWGAQLEALAFPTSYIPTTSAQVTRAADVAPLLTSGWYNIAQGTWYSEFIPMITTGTSRAILATNNYSMYLNASGAIGIYDGTNFPLNGTATNNALNKATTLYAQNTLISCLNGINPTTTSAYNNIFASATTLTISGNNLFNGRMKKISYYPQALTSTQLQSLTGS